MIKTIVGILSLIWFCLGKQIPCQFDTKFIPKHQSLNIRELLLKTRFGFLMIVDRNDKVVSKDISNTGTWQSSIIHLIRSLVNQGDNIINLGAQTGLQAILMALLVGQRGKVFAFEPYSFSYRIMRKSVYLNSLQGRIFTYNIGASNKYEIGTISVLYNNTGASEIHNRQQFKLQKLNEAQKLNSAKFNQVEKVVLNKLDNVLPENISFNFALIDIQKMQIEAIDGMRNIIKRSPNLVILTEWNYGISQDRDYKLGESVIQFLFDQGYQFFQLKSKQKCKMPSFIKRYCLNQLYLKDKNLLLLPRNMTFPKQ